MSKGGGSPQTTTQSIDPDVKQAYLGNLDYARDVSNQLGTQQFAGYNPQYSAGESQIEQAAQGGLGMQNLDTAAELTRAGAGYAPQQIGANQAAIQSYLNPYTQEVINSGLNDLERSRQSAIQQTGQQAMQAKAFGGSRQGVAEALTNQQYGTQAGSMIANLRSQGYTQALNASQQAAMANQQAGMAGAQFRMGAANQLGNMGQQQTAGQYQAGGALMGLGGSRQQFAQQQMDAERNLNLQRLSLMQGAIGLQPANLGGSSSSPTYSNPVSGALGGAIAGGQMFGPYGAAAGGLLGLFS
tara:strand:- start:26 stop:922 length:897 start_codon:yes stop_codon:yes gene_type:complete